MNKPLLALDTKYKAPDTPSTSDIQQIIAYATEVGCSKAWLVYPTPIPLPVSNHAGNITVQSSMFDLSGDLDEGGRLFLQEVLKIVGNSIKPPGADHCIT